MNGAEIPCVKLVSPEVKTNLYFYNNRCCKYCYGYTLRLGMTCTIYIVYSDLSDEDSQLLVERPYLVDEPNEVLQMLQLESIGMVFYLKVNSHTL
ncbi:hypothetical protein CK203_058227 [Vitis vinifera]|uniref:Uncharacterized protein n=1 Tax=Vitis vinifera TaxID=29760 RepID=A0A438H618_VITVI|nr:hypothetical protein CK203_058227 [Vitis vinifera]